MGIDCYCITGSPPCRAVHLAAKAAGVELNHKYTNLEKGDHMTPEFLKMNPQHTVPTLNDNGFCLYESRAIMSYFITNYGKDDSFYPKNPNKRALVDQRMYFDAGTLSPRFGDYYYATVFMGAKEFDPAKMTKIEEAFQFLDKFLANSTYAAGENLTIADLTLIATVTSYEVVGFDISRYPNVFRWLAKVKASAPGYEETNGKEVLAFKAWMEKILKCKK